MDSTQGQSDITGNLLDCLLELTLIYERRMTKESLVSGLPLKDNVLTPDLFQRAAERADFLSKACPLPFDDIHAGLLPCILFLENEQFCMLLEVKNNEAKIFTDRGAETIALPQLKKMYAETTILIKPKYDKDEGKEEAPFRIKNVTWFWEAIQSTWSVYAEVLVASFFINLFALASPLFVMNVYDRVVPNTAIETLWVLAIGVFVAYAFDFLLRLLRTHFVDNAAHNIDSNLSSRIFEHIIGIRMTQRPRSVGQIINTVQGFETFRDFMTSLTLTVLIDFPFTLLFVLFIAIIGGRLFLIPLCLMPVILLISFFIQAPLIEVVKKNYVVSGAKQQTLIESLVGITTVKTQNAEGVTQRKWERLVSYASELNTRLKLLTALAVNFSTFSQYIGSTAVVIVGVYMISNNKLTVGALIACTILTGRSLAPITQVVGLIMRYYQSLNSIQNVDTIMKLPVERPIGKKFLNPEKVSGKIEFKNVSFIYTNSPTKALTAVNLTVNPGEHVGIIGRVGSGKSTLLKLAIGLYEATEGKIFFSGSDIQEIDPMVVRKYIGYLSQDPILFSGTIRDNIVLGNPNASDDSVLHAISISGLESFISEHPDGINIQVGERGESLSGGQRQAVAIAQALLYDPPLLVFDEPTTSMDELNESAFKERMENIKKDKTLVLSTHKASMLTLVERIIILERGRVVADGPKDAVLQALREKTAHITTNPKSGN